MGGLLSGILGGGESSGQAAQMEALKNAQGAIQQYRPEAMNARLNALRNATGAYQGANNALQTMYGGGMPQGGGDRGQFIASGGKRFMGHDLPSGPTPPTGGPQSQGGARPQRGPDPVDAAFMMLDPLNLFGGR